MTLPQNDDLQSQNAVLQRQLEVAREALEAANEVVEQLETAVMEASEATDSHIAELMMDLDEAVENRADAEAMVEALATGSSLYRVTTANMLGTDELLAPIVVTDAMNDPHLFNDDNYVTDAVCVRMSGPGLEGIVGRAVPKGAIGPMRRRLGHG